MLAGYARVDITPALPVPLAGHVSLGERLATNVRDPLFATAIVIAAPQPLYALVTVDLLLIDRDLLGDVRAQTQALGLGNIHLMATHTHSSVGGYLKRDVAHLFMGKQRLNVREQLIAGIVDAVRQATTDLRPVEAMEWGASEVVGLTMNRRVKEGTRDDTVRFVQLRRTNASPILLLSNAGHPVVVSCKEPHTLSADYPGHLISRLQSQGLLPIFLTGAVAGSNILFPEMECSVNDHLNLLARLILGGLDAAKAAAHSLPGDALDADFGWASLDVVRQAPPRLRLFQREGLHSTLMSSVGRLFSRSLGQDHGTVQLPVSRLGPIVIVGMPADFSVYSSLDLLDRIKNMGYFGIVTSQTNDYIGYMHPSTEYKHRSDHKKEFYHYENAMTWYGTDMADRLVAAAADVVKKWHRVRQ